MCKDKKNLNVEYNYDNKDVNNLLQHVWQIQYMKKLNNLCNNCKNIEFT